MLYEQIYSSNIFASSRLCLWISEENTTTTYTISTWDNMISKKLSPLFAHLFFKYKTSLLSNEGYWCAISLLPANHIILSADRRIKDSTMWNYDNVIPLHVSQRILPLWWLPRVLELQGWPFCWITWIYKCSMNHKNK